MKYNDGYRKFQDFIVQEIQFKNGKDGAAGQQRKNLSATPKQRVSQFTSDRGGEIGEVWRGSLERGAFELDQRRPQAS